MAGGSERKRNGLSSRRSLLRITAAAGAALVLDAQFHKLQAMGIISTIDNEVRAQSFDSLFPEQIPLVTRLIPDQDRPEIEGWSESYHLPHGYLKDGAPYQELAWFILHMGEGLFNNTETVSVKDIRFPEVDYTVSLDLERYEEEGLRIRHKFNPGSTKAFPRDLRYDNKNFGLDFDRPITYTCVLREGLGQISDLMINKRRFYTPDTFQA